MLRKLLLIIAVGTVALIALKIMVGHRVANPNPRGTNIIAFGDSLTRGTGAGPGEDYPTLLTKLSGVPVINAGAPGETSGDALARLERDVLRRDPKIVIVFFGGNDMLQRVPTEVTVRNVTEIVRRIHDRGALTILVGMNGPPMMGGLNSEFQKIARDEGAEFVSNAMRGIIDNPKLKTDQVHPNAAGYRIIADRVYDVLKKYI